MLQLLHLCVSVSPVPQFLALVTETRRDARCFHEFLSNFHNLFACCLFLLRTCFQEFGSSAVRGANGDFAGRAQGGVQPDQLVLQDGEELHFSRGVLQVSELDPSAGQQDGQNEEGCGETQGLVPRAAAPTHGAMPPLMPASMWTRKDVRVFKDTVKKCADNVIRIGSLATATVSGDGRRWCTACSV